MPAAVAPLQTPRRLSRRAPARPRLKSDEACERLRALLLDGTLRAGEFVSQQDLV